MAINLAEKYSPKVVERFYTDSVILGKTSKEYEWDGVKSIKVYSINTVAPVNYARPEKGGPSSSETDEYKQANFMSRYGLTHEIGDTIQTMTVSQDKAVSMAVDKGNNTQQMLIKNAGKVVARELREQFVPMFDKYALEEWAKNAGTTLTAKDLTKSTIVEAISDAVTALINAETTIDDAYCYIGATNFAKLVLSDEFIKYGSDTLTTKALDRGVLGHVRGLQIVQVPDSYMPTIGGKKVNFLVVKKSCVLAPTKIKDIKIHEDAPGISGALMEIRWMYDAFVLEEKNKGVVVQTASTNA